MQEETIPPQEVQSLYFNVAPGVWGTKDVFVNIYMVQDNQSKDWVLIDTGLKSSASKIRKMADHIFGKGSKPAAILLTHGHFDHVGSLRQLLDEWDVPVYCHYLELPYLSGKSSYPPPDATVDGGLMAKMSWLFPRKPIDVSSHLHILPPDASVPCLSEWTYLYTPGHAPGHVSFFREKDRVLISGDAVVTTVQESVMSVMTQKKKLSGPPKYFTYDWEAAKSSLMHIAKLHPSVIAAGHGKPMKGSEINTALQELSRCFDQAARPRKGRYVNDPAGVNASGVTYLPPRASQMPNIVVWVAAGLLVAGGLLYLAGRKGRIT